MDDVTQVLEWEWEFRFFLSRTCRIGFFGMQKGQRIKSNTI